MTYNAFSGTLNLNQSIYPSNLDPSITHFQNATNVFVNFAAYLDLKLASTTATTFTTIIYRVLH